MNAGPGCPHLRLNRVEIIPGLQALHGGSSDPAAETADPNDLRAALS